VTGLCNNSKSVFSSSGDGSLGHYSFADGNLKAARDDFVKKTGTVLAMTASEENVYVLYHDMNLEILNADDINSSKAKTQ